MTDPKIANGATAAPVPDTSIAPSSADVAGRRNTLLRMPRFLLQTSGLNGTNGR